MASSTMSLSLWTKIPTRFPRPTSKALPEIFEHLTLALHHGFAHATSAPRTIGRIYKGLHAVRGSMA